ncbi:activator-dependent family glycosyltransferase [Spongiactinospora sp. TRM90649]|uniref:activator-dependent family glycosyltransferase n=1 Tax=Spongiactinospora sp. TRM90649 TaxID=3031114 RepID=UPI0023F7A598|nr:activator-dependent family glycosyltransferase [Spongiactinospora sp. TRM90649]MDF5759265.1 activator-dependent family glycosyltransferase [Spongiactinospora sp. TRM90649]
MRVLFVSHSEKPHYFGMVPLAWAFRTAGHEVRVAGQPELSAAVVESGLVSVPLGADHKWKQVMQEKDDDTWAARVVNAVSNSADLDHDELFEFYQSTTNDYFRTINNDEFVDDLVDYAREWRPDLVIWEQFTWAGAVAARACGAASVRMLWGADVVTRSRRDFLARLAERPEDRRVDPFADWLTEVLGRHGLEFDEEVVSGRWTLDAAPPDLRLDVGRPTVAMRFVPYCGPAELPEWLREKPARPRVAVTAGISLREYFGVDMFSIAALHVFDDLDIEVVATLVPGHGESVSHAPANAKVVDFVPMQGLLPTCAAVVHIGGAGIQNTAAHYGVPQLVLPGFWDSAVRAERVAASGAGLAIHPHEVTPDRVRDDLLRILTEPAFREAAERLRASMEAVPSPNEVVPELVRLVAEHRSG